jgi:hypothetical protein
MAEYSIPDGSESLVIQSLFADPAFTRFYVENRPRITIPIYWRVDPSLRPDSYECVHMQEPGVPEYAKIYVPYSPAQVEEARPIAHELTHLLLILEGYPGIRGRLPHPILIRTLGSLLSDAVVDRRLADRYGFNLKADPETLTQSVVSKIERMPLPPRSSLLYASWVLTSADVILDYETVTQSTTPHPLYEWLAQRHPRFIKDVNWIMGQIHSIGYYTPAQQERLLKSIIQRLNLAHFGIYIWDEKQREKARVACNPALK